MIKLRPLSDEDVIAIKKWPAYTGSFEQMDYALRENGWLDDFISRPDTWLYAVEFETEVIGFSLLSFTSDGEAEFRIAMHPHWTGRGLGKEVTMATLSEGFLRLKLNSVHLIVRRTNHAAARLYANLGFDITGESVHEIQGTPIEFIDMVMTTERFENIRDREGK